MNDQKRYTRTLIIITLIMIAVNYFISSYFTSRTEQGPAKPAEAQTQTEPVKLKTRQEALADSDYLTLQNDVLSVKLNAVTLRVEEAVLHAYKQEPNGNEAVELLSPENSDAPHYAEFGWTTDEDGKKLPRLAWKVDEATNTSIKLSAEDSGIVYNRVVNLDDQYLVTVTDTVTNATDHSLAFRNVSKLVQQHPGTATDNMVLNEGIVGVLDDSYKEISYKDLKGDKRLYQSSNGGWVGFNDKYWLTAMLKAPGTQLENKGEPKLWGGGRLLEITRTSLPINVASKESRSTTHHLFVGPKQLDMLDKYEAKLNVPKFDLAVDFGWFSFITKPLFKMLVWFNSLFGSVGLAIILLTILTKAVLLPIAIKGQRSMEAMKALQPEIAKLKEQYGDNKAEMNQRMMALYQQYKVNPFSGCLPILIQIPVFFALYKVFNISIEMRHAPFLWVSDLSAADPTNVFTLFGLVPYELPGFLNLGIWPIMVGVTMYLQQISTPQMVGADPTQAKMMRFMPLILTFVFANFAVGVLLYWVCNNLLSIAQQVIMPKFLNVKLTKQPVWKKPRKQQ